jgi:signal transduction histidine kinase
MSIRIKLTIIFLSIASIPLILVSVLTYSNFKSSLESNRFAQLEDLSVFRADRIEAYFADLKASMEIAQGFYIIKKNFSVLNQISNKKNNPEIVAYKKALGDQLKHMQSVSDMTDIMLVNPEGKIFYSNNPRHFLKDLSRGIDVERTAFTQGETGVYFSDIYFDSTEDKRFEMLVSAPATDFGGAFIGVIAFEVDMTPVYRLIQDTTGLGATGEVLVGKRNGNQVEFLNPLRHDPAAALSRKTPIGDVSGYPIQQAVQGKTGSGIAIDYRGKPVIAAWKYIPSMHWGLVAKIDAGEAFADVTNLRDLVLMILAIVIALSGVMAFSMAQSISRPIKQLSEGAAKIGSGNLDFKLAINQKDEIGRLSRSFEKMTRDLKSITTSRDELNKEIDIRKKAETALLKTAEDLARSNKDLEQFAYVASHDLQEPLRAVAGFMGLLKKQFGDAMNETAKEYMDFAVEGAERMQRLIDDLLSYSRVGTRGRKFAIFPMKDAFDNAIKNLKIAIDEANATVTCGDMPEIYGDASQMTQLLQNLIGNAIKFHGPKRPEINVIALRKDGHWQISVADNGIGIEPQYFERIFLIFQRLHGRAQYKGTGIGLAVCKRIVERHGGRIWVESKPNEGTVFYFTIPDQD